MSKSIVTLQLGNYSNFIGSHYWNLHEFSFENSNNNAFNNDVNYYEGLTTNNDVTFTPKVISWDWKENLGPRIIDDIYEEMENRGDISRQSRREIDSLKVNSYQGKVEINTGFTSEELNVNKTNTIFDKDYKEWNEYLYARLHHNSLTKLPKLYRNFDSTNFRNFSQGLDLTQNKEYFERMEDQTRYFVEKCDVLQGFQVICDADDGFSGVGMNFLNQLSDEYSKDIISFPTSTSTEDDVDGLFNKIFLFNEMNSKSVFWSPISVNYNAKNRNIPNINYDVKSKYQTSAILALSLKSLLLPCFLNNDRYTLSDYSSVVNNHNNNMASVAMSMPFPIKEKDTLENSLLNLLPKDFYTVLNPYFDKIDRFDSVIGNIFGIDNCRAKNANRKSDGMFDQCSNVVQMMEMLINANCLPKHSQFLSSLESIKLSQPFPRFFSSNVDQFSGELLPDTPNMTYHHCPRSIPVSTMLFSSDNSDYLTPLYESANSALKSRKINSLMLQLESDYLIEAVENFRAMI